MDKIKTDCLWVILKKVGPTFFKFTANRLDKSRFCSDSFYLSCNDNIISKGIPVSSFKLVIN